MAEDRFVQKSYLGTVILILLMLVMVGLAWTFLPPQVPLFFSKPWGEGRLVATPFLLLLPGLSMAIGLLNLISSNFIQKENELLGKGLAVVAFLFAFMATVAMMQILRTVL